MGRAHRIQLSGPALVAVFLALTLGATLARGATAGGGLSVNPAVIEHPAAVGAIDSIVVINTTTTPQNIKITPRPWVSSTNGLVNPDFHNDLDKFVKVSRSSFTLPAGASQAVVLTLRAAPPGGSLYGAIVTVGQPADEAKRPGITVGYRLISRLRLDPTPATRKLKAVVSAPHLAGKNIVLTVRNTGNTIEPIIGAGIVSSALGTRNFAIAPQRILPGASSAMVVTPLKGLRPGKYSVTYTLVQSGVQVGFNKHATVVVN